MNAAAITGTTLRTQAGVRNADLAALLPQGGSGRLLLPGGNCPAVGVVGLTLGGGIGPNAPWAGLTADRLRKATMVTAAGDVVTASASENPDLFWGLRGGGGGNFGVITDLEYELVEVPVTRATTAQFAFSGRDAALAGAMAFQKVRADAGRMTGGNLYLGHSGGDIEGSVQAQELSGEAEARKLFRPLLAVPGVEAQIVERPWWDTYRWYITEPSPAYSFWDRSLYADDYLAEDALARALDVVQRFPANGDPERGGAMGIYGWVGGAVNDVAAQSSAYVHRSAKILVEMSAGWATPREATLPDNPIRSRPTSRPGRRSSGRRCCPTPTATPTKTSPTPDYRSGLLRTTGTTSFVSRASKPAGIPTRCSPTPRGSRCRGDGPSRAP